MNTITRQIKNFLAHDKAGILLVLFCIGIFLWLSFSYNFLSDDAFIYFRYVKNFLHGFGPVFNKGDYTDGYTSPLWFLLLTLLGKLGIDLVIAGRFLSEFFGILQIILLYVFLRKIHTLFLPKAIGLLFLSTANVIAVWGLSGMDVTLYSFLVFANFVLTVSFTKWSRNNLLILGLATVVLILTRLEGFFVLCISTGYIWITAKKARTSLVIYYVIPVVLITLLSCLIRYTLYSEFLPNTFYGRVSASVLLYERGIGYIFSFFSNYSFVFGYVLLLLFALFYRSKITILSLLFIVFICAEVILEGADGLPMYRFLLPTIVYFAVLLTIFVEYVWHIPSSDKKNYFIFTAILLITTLLTRNVIPAIDDDQYVLYQEQKDYEVPQWTLVGKWLKTDTKPTDSVASAPIGSIGYYSDLYLYDMLGLVTRHIAFRNMTLGTGWAGHEKHDGQWILSQRPTYLLLSNVQVSQQPLDFSDPEFVKKNNPAIRAREDDIFTPELWKLYEKHSDYIGDGYYLNYLKLKNSR